MWADDWTDEKLAELEKKISEVYEEARRDLDKKAERYFKKFEQRYKKEYEAYKNGEYTRDEFISWVYAQIGRGTKWETLRDTMAERVTNANEVAASYINDYTPTIFSLNANFEAFIAEGSHPNVSFTLFNEVTVKRLIEKDRKILPERKIDVPKDLKWNQKKLQNALLQGILQGESTGKIANRFANVANMNRSSAIRNARTAVTGAQNAGIYETMKREESMGITGRRYWNSTKDLKTRPSHRLLDKEERKVGEKFSNGLLYPGDMNGRPEEIYGCRCVIITEDRVQATKRKERVGNPQWLALGDTDKERKEKAKEIKKTTGKNIPETVVVNEISYREWEKWKDSQLK